MHARHTATDASRPTPRPGEGATPVVIERVSVEDRRFPLAPGEGADAVHGDPIYSYAVTRLHAGRHHGTGLAFTLGAGTELVCAAARLLAEPLAGREIEALMADWGRVQRGMADHAQLRWLGPHKGVVHLALASVTNACFDLWARARGVPLWRLLLDLDDDAFVALLDLSYLEDALTPGAAREILRAARPTRGGREGMLRDGYPGYDTSVGWIGYTDAEVAERVRRAVGDGFTAVKLKVGSAEPARDVRRAALVREAAGAGARVMVDANQRWSVPEAVQACRALSSHDLFWVEEPTHPDDLLGHQTIAREAAPVRLAAGEHLPNRVVFKNYLASRCLAFAQPDCVRLAGVSEFLAVSLLARAAGVPVVPHVGDMGQLHQHLVLVNHVAMGHEALFLEYIPHLAGHFRAPAAVVGGRYQTPEAPGASTELLP